MPAPASQESMPPPAQDQSLGTTGLVISALGLAGWAIMLVAILAVPKEDYTGDGQRDLLIGLGNFFGYLFQVLIGVAGMSINGTLSTIGTALSAGAIKQPASPRAKIGLILGIMGLGIGFLVVIWRMAAWGVFSA